MATDATAPQLRELPRAATVLGAAAPAGSTPHFVDLAAERRPFVLVMLRHLACNCAPLGIADILAAAPAGTSIVAVTSSPDAAAAQHLLEEQGVAGRDGFQLLIDPTLALYSALGLPSSVLATLTWRRWRNLAGALAFPFQLCCRRRVPFFNAGQPFQQGGVFVFAADGACLLAHRETSPAWPPLDEAALAAAVAAAKARGSGPAAPRGSSGTPLASPATRARSRRDAR